ncbi:MAG: hypothetical protein RIC51_02710 [Erythrobacter sp.]|uniref:hypothetical protein n=1 Tax=Erythrobacter sp. TaxID=1042 RepID=UPI0032EFF852
MEPGDPPILSPDGRYAFAHGEIERRNNEWLPFAYIEDTRRERRIVQLGTGQLVRMEWTGPATFKLSVSHERDPDLCVTVHGDAATARYEFAEEALRGPLKDLERALERWFDKHLPPPPRDPVRPQAARAETYEPVSPGKGGPGIVTLLIGFIAIVAFVIALGSG